MKHAIRNLPLSFLLVVAATTVAISRYMVVAGATEHYTVLGDVWNWFNIICGACMAILEGVSVWYCWRAWSAAKQCIERNVLLVLIAATVVCLYGSIMPTIASGASGVPFSTIVTGGWMLAWATCVTVAPFAIMSANAIAGTLSSKVEAVAEVVVVAPAEVAPVVTEELLARPTLIEIVKTNPDAKAKDLAEALGISRQAVSAQLKKLEDAGTIRRNGHIEVVEINN